jgi:hypothetical protein
MCVLGQEAQEAQVSTSDEHPLENFMMSWQKVFYRAKWPWSIEKIDTLQVNTI